MATYAHKTIFHSSSRLKAKRMKLRFQYATRTNATYLSGRFTIFDDPAPRVRKWLRKHTTGEYISFFRSPHYFEVHLEKEKDALAFRLCFSDFN